MTFLCKNSNMQVKHDLSPIEQHTILSHLWRISNQKELLPEARAAFEKVHVILGCLFNGEVHPSTD